jgi:urease accessory protein
MLRFTELIPTSEETRRQAAAAGATAVLTLRFEDRRRSRMRARLDDGREAALLLPHGTILRDGDRVRAPEGPEVAVVRAAAQSLSVVHCDDPLLLARAAYHLGNRHIPVQLGAGWLAYEHDHVLDGMVADLGLSVETRVAPFEPEAGGYGRTSAAGAASHAHGHAHHHHDH